MPQVPLDKVMKPRAACLPHLGASASSVARVVLQMGYPLGAPKHSGIWEQGFPLGTLKQEVSLPGLPCLASWFYMREREENATEEH